MAANEGNSNQHARLSRPTTQATAGEAIDLDGLSTAAGAAALPGVTMYGPAAEALLEGAEYGAETEGVAGSSDAAAAARMRRRRRECGRQDKWIGWQREQREQWKTDRWAMRPRWRRRRRRAKAATGANAESVTDGAPGGQRPKPGELGNHDRDLKEELAEAGREVALSPWYPKRTSRLAPWYLPSQKAW